MRLPLTVTNPGNGRLQLQSEVAPIPGRVGEADMDVHLNGPGSIVPAFMQATSRHPNAVIHVFVRHVATGSMFMTFGLSS